MSFTIAGYNESQDTAGVLVDVAALTDQHLTTDGDDILVPDDYDKLMGAFALGVTITGARITSPTLRKRLNPDLSPLNIGAEPAVRDAFHDYFDNPIQLTPGEGLRAQVSEGASGAELESVFVWLGNGEEEAVSGEIFTVKLTGATTLVANAWSLVPLTISQQLEAGTWGIVGMRAISAGAQAARLVIPGSSWRPGVIAWDAENDIDLKRFRRGASGLWGKFSHSFLPQCEFKSVSADTSETVYLDLVKLG